MAPRSTARPRRGQTLRLLRKRIAVLPAGLRVVGLLVCALGLSVALLGSLRVAGLLVSPNSRMSTANLYTSNARWSVSAHRPASRVLTVPDAYGFGAPVIENVLSNVTEFIAGGLDVDWEQLAAEADDTHMHGRWIGARMTEKGPEALWEPTEFDFSKETEAMKRVAHTKSCFNKRRSDSLPLHRPIPDVRATSCKNLWYYATSALPGMSANSPPPRRGWFSGSQRQADVNLDLNSGKVIKQADGTTTVDYDNLVLPDTSVVFVMFNEPLSPLLRSIYSVLDRTPPQLLTEIIVVDDGSDEEAPWLARGGVFEKHIGFLPKVKLARLHGRNGLMRARNVGISLAVGSTITVLDSHIEVNSGWLEPLMARIAEGKAQGINRVVVPAIDSIDADNFKYTAGGIDILGHSWTLGQVGVYRPKAVVGTDAMPSPIMAGGLLSLDRAWFNELGYYDPLMRLWGGEETEISFRIWQCGGTLECVPCSRVGHIFRSSKHWQGQVYKVPGHEVTRNKLRTASVWMDEYADLVKLASAPLPAGVEIGSLDYMRGIRERLQCKSYSWYLNNVFPEILPSADRLMGAMGSGSLKANGYLRNPATGACVDTLNRKHAGEPIGAYPCHYLHGTQALVAAADGTIVVAELTFSSCLTRESEFAKPNASVAVINGKCDENDNLQKWVSHREDNSPGWIYEKEAEGGSDNPHGCLTVVQTPEEDGKSPYTLRTQECTKDDGNQLWEWETIGSPKINTEPPSEK